MPQAKRTQKRIGLAIIGAGRVGLFRGEVAARHGSVDWIGIAEILPERAKDVAAKVGADFVTNDYRELLRRPELTAAVISTDEHLHVDPVLGACERGIPLLIGSGMPGIDNGRALRRVVVPGANVVIASNPLLAHIVASSMSEAGFENRGAIARLVMTMRGGDRPKNAHEEFNGVSVMPRGRFCPVQLIASRSASVSSAMFCTTFFIAPPT